ncbi:AAA family ATPase [Embleya sp. NPDC050154]|uniref:helix-turn-helix transcriptional regulator n=1 Tax=Embleya sp. NPDC050154 TaxID=3363988 RepID=UPI0037963411
MAHTDPTRHDLMVLARRRLTQGGVVLHGPAGIGKTFVLRSLLPTAARGIPILHTEPTSAEAELAFSSLADLLDPVADEVIEALPCPQRSAIRVVLCREPPGPDGPDPLALRRGVLTVLRALSAATPVHVAIDGAQWMDAAGAEVLAFAARRLDPTRVRVIVAETTDPPAGPIHGTRFCPGTPSELELPPLGLSETRDLLDHHDLDHDLDPDRLPDRSLPHWLSRQVYEASAGNPMYALELAGSVRRSARLPDRDQPLPVPDRLRRLLIARLEGLAPEARRLLLLAGAAARPTVGLLRTAVGLSYDSRDARVAAADRAGEDLVRRTLADATSAGILDPHRDDGRLRFTHPLFAAALYADGSPEQRRAAHAALAALSGEPIDRARHLALAAPAPNERVAATLMSAAEQARRRGMSEDAAALARLAVARTPDEHADRRCERCLDGAGHAYAAADFELARELAHQVFASGPSPGQRVRACIVIINAANQALHDLDEVFAEAFAQVGDDPGGRARLHYLRACKAHISDGDSAIAWAEAARAAAIARQADDRGTEQVALALQAFVGTLQGRPDACVPLARALARPQDAGPTGRHAGPRGVKARLDFFADRLVDAGAELDRMLRRAEESDDAEERLFGLCGKVDVDVRAGRCAEAMTVAHEALRLGRDIGAHLGLAYYSAAVAEAAGGDLARAAALAREGVRAARADRDLVYLPLALCVLGQAQGRLRDPVGAVGCLSRARAIAARRGIVDPAAIPWSADLAEALVAVGDHDQARAIVAEVRDTAGRLGRSGVLASLARAHALVRGESGDLAGAATSLRESAARHLELGLPIEHGRDLLALGSVELRRRHPAAALASWRAAESTFDKTAARPWLEQTRVELARLTSVDDPESADGPLRTPSRALTAAEHRVAELVGDGATNREIAGRLFLSAKTVESTLTRVYRKLGIRSRAELIRLSLDPSEEPDSTGRGTPKRLPALRVTP